MEMKVDSLAGGLKMVSEMAFQNFPTVSTSINVVRPMSTINSKETTSGDMWPLDLRPEWAMSVKT